MVVRFTVKAQGECRRKCHWNREGQCYRHPSPKFYNGQCMTQKKVMDNQSTLFGSD